ncbi:MAG: hypothetical protein A2Z71_03090 [Chloroflexi bacterium RBG_13_50_21]|nr:MAG: hypothetical protein A2Z71_03090 [Chloroflexi bacterium RBG_13_50_21]OGO59696.1 MAG: hypothetical protein A2029_14465 [Chloroflexi bacterium RBG_19FT_COMBO_47_9]
MLAGGTSFKTNWTYKSANLVSSRTYPASDSGRAEEVVIFTYLAQMLLDIVIGTSTYKKNRL